MGRTKDKNSNDTETLTREKVRVKKPKQYKVVLINDDYTTMDFVVSVLETIFMKTPSESVRIMLQVHRQGRGVCGIFSRQIAEAKVELVHKRARSTGFPLQCVIEEA